MESHQCRSRSNAAGLYYLPCIKQFSNISIVALMPTLLGTCGILQYNCYYFLLSLNKCTRKGSQLRSTAVPRHLNKERCGANMNAILLSFFFVIFLYFLFCSVLSFFCFHYTTDHNQPFRFCEKFENIW